MKSTELTALKLHQLWLTLDDRTSKVEDLGLALDPRICL